MSVYYAKFSRYSKSKTIRENSGAAQLANCNGFNAAVAAAYVFIDGMRNAEPDADWEYEIVSLHTTDFSGMTYQGYISIWQNPPSVAKK